MKVIQLRHNVRALTLSGCGVKHNHDTTYCHFNHKYNTFDNNSTNLQPLDIIYIYKLTLSINFSLKTMGWFAAF